MIKERLSNTQLSTYLFIYYSPLVCQFGLVYFFRQPPSASNKS